ncbi:MAG: hypothetical protein AB7H97_06305 [Pseudobdellovibrionaceae bacterium]
MKTKTVKKTLDVPENMSRQIQSIIDSNYGTTFTQIAIQALSLWLEEPKLTLKDPRENNNARKSK